MMNTSLTVKFEVNGAERTVEIDTRDSLLDVLRDSLDLTGSKKGCDETVCGACAVLVNGRAVCSCTMLAAEAQGQKIVTIEGLSEKNELSPIQKAFWVHDSLQCGFCTSGQIISSKGFLDDLDGRVPSEEEIKEALSGNICRCGAYNKIVEAVAEVAALQARKMEC
ncbi:MAG: (2Fe-2S)-binding protein [Thaumarchaeota archaeon]|nr:(2Fe-2S)-binding protein [Nitrososphaerota archaeon]